MILCETFPFMWQEKPKIMVSNFFFGHRNMPRADRALTDTTCILLVLRIVETLFGWQTRESGSLRIVVDWCGWSSIAVFKFLVYVDMILVAQRFQTLDHGISLYVARSRAGMIGVGVKS